MEKKTAKRPLKGAVSLFFLVLLLVAPGVKISGGRIGPFDGETASSRLCFSEKESEENANGERERLLAFGIVPVGESSAKTKERIALVPGGELFGVRMEINGLLVAKTGPVEGTKTNPAALAGIKPGDRIVSAEGVSLRGCASLTKLLAKSGGNPVTLEVDRDGERMITTLNPIKDPNGVWRAGLWLREGAAGIGTVTYKDPETGSFAGLGHGVCDGETGKVLPMLTGSVCRVKPEGAKPATISEPGEIRGELEKGTAGVLTANSETGIYGSMETEGSEKAIPIAFKDEIKPGKATILCQLDETGKKEYSVVIEKICDRNGETKNFILRVTDPDLIEKTGGIIQGMSGSPVIQNGKLIGAVTHVMLRDPEQGYGIFIENMLKGAEAIREPEAA